VIDGIVVGDSREKGMVRGNEFVHPVMRFSLRFPEGWEISNGSDQVAAVPVSPKVSNDPWRWCLELSKSAQGSVEQTGADGDGGRGPGRNERRTRPDQRARRLRRHVRKNDPRPRA
jgi:hypothetical protein